MVFCRQVNFFILSRWTLAAILSIMVAASCTVPKKYQKGKPFIYRSTVELQNTDLSNSRRQELKDALINQMDDSLRVKTVIAVDFWPLIYNRLSKPAVFDSAYIGKSKTLMRALLKSQGYFEPAIRDTFSIDTVKRGGDHQQRVSVKFIVSPGKALLFDSVGYDLTTPELQQLAMNNRNKALVKKGNNYSIQAISNELDRLLNIYRDNGYYKISKEDMYAEHDTVVAALIDPSLDPFEQFALLDSLSKRKREPTINVVFKQRVPKDSTHLNKYYWGTVNVYPDRPLISDSTLQALDTIKISGLNIFPLTRKFKIPFIARNIAMRPGSLYRQSDYYKTINTFTNLGAWAQVDINLKEKTDTVRFLDADVLLYPAKKQSLTIDFETSRNATDLLTTGSLFGIGLNLGVRNRNGFRESISNTSNLRFGVELGPNIVQTLQASFSHNIFVPRFILPFKINQKNTVAPRTVINFNTSYTNRREFVEVRSVNTSFGYDWSKKNHSWQYLPFNFEYTNTNKTDSFARLEAAVPSIAQAFNNGLIISQIGSYTTGTTIGKNTKFFRARLEESGAIFGLINKLERGELRRFLKLDVEYKYFINNPKSTWAFRAFGGYGYAYGKTGDQKEYNLPFFKSYFGGGPYSMRAWAVRRLGLGSSSFYDTVGTNGTDRWGDFKLEGNIEYRFDLGSFLGIKLESAIFTDMGNIWSKTYDSELNRIDSTNFKLDRLYADLAIGAGTSLRFDFDFFLIRLDWAYQIKNPVYARENDGWFHKLQINSGQFQLGIGYPF